MTRLKEQYDSQIKAAMMKKFGYKNEMQIPKLVKIVVNMGVGDANSLIVLLTLLYHVYVTLEVLILTRSTEEETTHLVLKSS